MKMKVVCYGQRWKQWEKQKSESETTFSTRNGKPPDQKISEKIGKKKQSFSVRHKSLNQKTEH